MNLVASKIWNPFGSAEGFLVGQKQLAEAGVLVKPKLRGLLAAQIKRNVFVGSCLSVAGGLAFKIFIADVRKERYREYYRTHDADKDFEEMKKKGVFQSCPTYYPGPAMPKLTQ